MKITLNIETNDPADLERIAAALAGNDVAVTAKPAPAKAAAAAKAETPSAAAQAPASAAPASTPALEQPAATSPSDQPVPSEAELIAAANAAVAKVGNGGPAKIKDYVAANYTKADGSPGTLKLTAENQRAALLDALMKIGRGEIAL